MLFASPGNDLPDPKLLEFLDLMERVPPAVQLAVARDLHIRAARTKLLQHAYVHTSRYFQVVPPQDLAGVAVRLIGADPAYTK